MNKSTKRKINKKGNITIYLVFIIIAVVTVLVAGFVAPMGVKFNTAMYEAGEDIINGTVGDLSGINDVTVREDINSSLQGGLLATQNNIEVNNALFQYGWIFALATSALVLFLFSRRLVEYGGGIV